MFTCRWFGAVAFCLPVAVGAMACSTGQDDTGSGTDDVTTVPESGVKDQSTDICWIYATTGWVESLHLGATGETLNLSETYLTYWNYFDQIVAGEVTGGMVEEGGSWGEAADKILKYGMINAGDFVAAEATEILSKDQAAALKAVDKALKSGELRTGAARRDRAGVRAFLDKAFKLTPAMIAQLDATFGKDVSKTLDKDYASAPLPAGVTIKKASDFKAKLKNPTTNRIDTVTVEDAMGTHKATNNLEHRNGDYAWQDVAYPKSDADRRTYLIRVQRALTDHLPVVINWTVDFAALTDDGRFPDVPTGPPMSARIKAATSINSPFTTTRSITVPGFGSLESGPAGDAGAARRVARPASTSPFSAREELVESRLSRPAEAGAGRIPRPLLQVFERPDEDVRHGRERQGHRELMRPGHPARHDRAPRRLLDESEIYRHAAIG